MNELMLPAFRRTAFAALFLSGTAVAALAQTPLVAVSLPDATAYVVTTAPAARSAPAAASSEATAPDSVPAVPGPVTDAASNPLALPISSPFSASSLSASSLSALPSSSSDGLPDAPSATALRSSLPEADLTSAESFDPADQATPTVAPRLTKYIPSGWTAQPITAHDKVLLGLRDLYSPLNFIAMIASAGYEHVLNSEPNYGTDKGAFGERLGAAAIRESSQGFLTDSLFSPLFHEDPRYYIQGDGHSFLYRTAYAATRPFITRTDNGNSTLNAALLVAYAGSAGLSYAYYPQSNRNFHDTASTFGDSLGGAALGYFVSEFSDDALKAFHLRKK